MLQAIFSRDPALRPTLSSIKRSSFFQGVNWNHLETTFEEAKHQVKVLVQQITATKNIQGIREHSTEGDWVNLENDPIIA